MKRLNTLLPALAAATLLTGTSLAHDPNFHVDPLTHDTLAPAPGFEWAAKFEDDRSFHSQIAFYETVLSHGKNNDPRSTMILVNAYLVSNQQKEGIKFFEAVIDKYGDQMDADTKAVYLSGYAILRATYAEKVMLLRRIGWVNDTFDILEEAEAIFPDHPIVHWASGLIYAQVPGMFGKKKDAYEHLEWIAEHPETEPVSGMYRATYLELAKLYKKDGKRDQFEKLFAKAGFTDHVPAIPFMGWFTTSEEGTAMDAVPTVDEIVPGRVFDVTGFGFGDIHFVVSESGESMFAIDVGAQPKSFEKAYALLKEQYPDLPPITVAFITHSHWDHIGGMKAFKQIVPNAIVYGRENYHGVLDRVMRDHSYHTFRSTEYTDEWVKNYHPDVEISERQTLLIDCTQVEFIPVTGGETEDALLFHFPEVSAVFVGDVLMPYYGEPWVEEGDLGAAIETMDAIIDTKAEHVRHGHKPLSFLYTAESVKTYRDAYAWLVQRTSELIKTGHSINDIIRLNLIPSGLENHPDAYISYLSPRDHIIARVSDKLVGIWQENKDGRSPQGLHNITAEEYGRLFDLYLNLSPSESAEAIERMIENGDNELAFEMAVAVLKRHPGNKKLAALFIDAGDRLRSEVQFFDPFKFTVYSEIMGVEHRPMGH